MTISWSAFEAWTQPQPTDTRSWGSVTAWMREVEGLAGAERTLLAQRRAESDEALRDICGDPLARDWSGFLPLRRDREEDWSDWLAQLLQDSTTGHFAQALLGAVDGHPSGGCLATSVRREVPVEQYRADIVVEWPGHTYTHVEVKVGDDALIKTLETSLAIERSYGGARARRKDFVLLLPEQVEDWAAKSRLTPGLGERVDCLTWIDVARALRSALRPTVGEPLHWRVWASTFCGAIEQDLLSLPGGATPEKWASALRLRDLPLADALFSRESHA